MLPCTFQPGSEETIEWFRQDEVVYKFERDDDDSSSKEHFEHGRLEGRASIFPHLVSRGNATLVLTRSGLKDRGTYRCHVRTSEGEHDAKVIVKVEGEFVSEAAVIGGFIPVCLLSLREQSSDVVFIRMISPHAELY